MILIGIKRTEASGSFHGIDGLEGFNISGTNISIIKEGTKEELVDYVVKTKKQAKIAQDEFIKVQDKLERGHYNLSVDDYDAAEIKYRTLAKILKYDTLMIVEGFIL